MSNETRNCPYCNIPLKNPYWRHIESEHPDEYRSDKNTWIQLFKDYVGMGMSKEVALTVISQIFNRDPEIIRGFLKKNKAI